MATNENLHKDGDTTDLESDTSILAQGISQTPEPLFSGGVRQDGTGRGGAGADAAFYNVGVDDNGTLPALTAVTIATGSGAAGTISVTFTKGTGVAKAEVSVYKASDKSFVKKGDMTSTGTFTGLTAATSYIVIIRPIGSDGSVGTDQSKTTVTSHA